MRLIKQPNGWSCFPTALAMIMDLEPSELFKVIGHDGSEIILAGVSDPHCRRGFHPQELNFAAWKYGYSITHFGKWMCCEYVNGLQTRRQTPFDIRILLDYDFGILTSLSPLHAVAWNPIEKKIYDPNGTIYNLENFNYEDFFLVKAPV
jgi:hypothetical protein